MRIAALYDVHAMPWALEAVLGAVDDERIDRIVFGGDYLYGPYPRETVAMIRALEAIVLRGNCEDLAEEWERAELAPGDVEWLQSLPLAAVVDDETRRGLDPEGCQVVRSRHRRFRLIALSDRRAGEVFARRADRNGYSHG